MVRKVLYFFRFGGLDQRYRRTSGGSRGANALSVNQPTI